MPPVIPAVAILTAVALGRARAPLSVTLGYTVLAGVAFLAWLPFRTFPS